MSVIPLTKGKEALVDDECMEKLQDTNWYFNGRYAARRYKNETQLLHRYLMNAPDNMVIDHINGNTLDNRLSNLRVVSQSENLFNTKLYASNTTGYKGVCYDKHAQKYKASIRLNGISKHLGLYSTAEEANTARINYEISIGLLRPDT